MKGRRRHARGLRIGKYVNLGFKALGAVVALSPSFTGIKAAAGGDVEGGMQQIVVDFTGFLPRTGQFIPAKAASGIGSVVAGVVLSKLGAYLGRRM